MNASRTWRWSRTFRAWRRTTTKRQRDIPGEDLTKLAPPKTSGKAVKKVEMNQKIDQWWKESQSQLRGIFKVLRCMSSTSSSYWSKFSPTPKSHRKQQLRVHLSIKSTVLSLKLHVWLTTYIMCMKIRLTIKSWNIMNSARLMKHITKSYHKMVFFKTNKFYFFKKRFNLMVEKNFGQSILESELDRTRDLPGL